MILAKASCFAGAIAAAISAIDDHFAKIRKAEIEARRIQALENLATLLLRDYEE